MKLLNYFVLGLALLSFSCTDDKDADDVIPEKELSMERTFMFHDNHETQKASYTTKDFQSGIILENEKLTLYLGANPDAISFEILETDLKDGYVGIYSLKSLPDPETGKVKTNYLYNNNDGSGSAYFSEGNFMNGTFEITTYNDAHNLITGTFELTMEDVPDPTIKSPTTNPRRCDVTITGTFKNARITSTP